MKVQCYCGAKYAFDATPEMLTNPVTLVCQNCNTDLSSFVNELVQQEFAAAPATPAEPPPAPAPEPEPASAPVSLPAPPQARITISPKPPEKPRLSLHREAPKEVPAEAAAEVEEFPTCLKHPQHQTTEKCVICQKPICPACMELFGYVCSPHCRAKASANGIEVPVYEFERSHVEAKFRAKVMTGIIAAGIVAAALISFWAWYVVAGRLPRPYYSAKFKDAPAHSGEVVVSPDRQLVFLHGTTLARHDLKTKQPVWSRELASRPADGSDLSLWRYESMIESLSLRVQGQNIWVFSPGKLTRYDWNTGEPKQELPLKEGEAIWQGDEALLINATPGQRTVTHISLASGETTVEHVAESAANGKKRRTALALSRSPTASLGRMRGAAAGAAAGGLPTQPSDQNLNTALDPALIANQVQSMSLPARIALPATLSSSMYQERLFREMDSLDNQNSPAPAKGPAANPLLAEDYALVPLKDGCLQFSSRLLEERIVTRTAMKPKPTKSALDGKVNAAATAAIANELLNEMQRDRGGDQVTENQSRYWVTLRRADEKVSAEWVGEVTGEPGVMTLDTVTVLVAGESIHVFDRANKELWKATLTFPVPLEHYSYMTSSREGAGPCVERDGALYVADKGVLTAFDLLSGNVRWRLPSVGITGMFFDEAGMIYLNTTTADLDSIKFEKQIDVTKRVDEVVMKIDPHSGKQLWTAQPGGAINYVAGKYLFVVSTSAGDWDENGDSKYGLETGLEKSALMVIRRLNPKNGEVIWRYQQQRCPIDLKFHENEIQAVFRREVQVLKFMTF